MSKNLVIVESPKKAQTIQKYLGKNYEVEASMGHVRDLPKSKLGIDVDNDFQPKYMTIRGKADLIKKLKKAVKNSDKVILAADPDREGEAISWHLTHALDIPKEKAVRVTFNEITKDAVKQGIKNPREIDYDLVDAQQARRVLDRIVGYSISPLLWRKVKKGLSAGRVQSVAMKILCDREAEIDAFNPEEYWTITATLQAASGGKSFKAKFFGKNGKKMRLENQQQAQEVLDALKDADFVVDNVKKSVKKRVPAAPFITSTLQQEVARKLGFTSSRTMMIAQQLYEGVDIKGKGTVGLITYMRTDSTRIAKEAQAAARAYISEKWGEEYLPKTVREYKNKKNAQDAHEAIRPSISEYAPDDIKGSLTTDQYKLYKLIWSRFMASQMECAEVETETVDITAGGYTFKSQGERVLFPGFTTLYIEGKDIEDEEDKSQMLPEMYQGDILKKKQVAHKQNFTSPPPRYSEASLIRMLEELGIGRPSTYAPTITTIYNRRYVEKVKKLLIPTDLGKVVNSLMSEHFEDIVDAGFTANMERELDRVEDGEVNWVDVVREFYNPFKQVLDKADKNIEHVVIEPEVTDIICEKCGKNMVIREGRYGRFLACPGYPQCRNAKPILNKIGIKCPKCGGEILEKKTHKGAKYFGCENNTDNNCDFMTWDKPTDEKCPNCGKMLVFKSIKKRITNLKACIDPECEYNKKEKKKK